MEQRIEDVHSTDLLLSSECKQGVRAAEDISHPRNKWLISAWLFYS